MPNHQSKAYKPTNGVRTDFKHLMNIFLSSATVRFEQFSEVWRALNMSYLCAGRNSDREAREFIEKVLVIAREYFLPPYQFQARVGGLYLLYAIYQIQPISPKVKIRLTPQQWDDSLHFQLQAKQQSHLDVVYIFNRLIQEQAFQFCFTPQEIGTHSNSWESEDAEVDLADEMKEEKCIINKLFNYESLEQLSYLQDQYQRMKVALAGPHATKPDKSLNVVKEELVEDIVLSLQSFKENVANMSKRVGNSKQKAEEELRTTPQTVGSRRQALKNQAYGGSPSTRNQRLNSASPEKNLAIDRANRAAQRALTKLKANDDQFDDAESDVCEVSLTSTTRSQAEACSAVSLHKKNLSVPQMVPDDEELSSGDGSDDDYVPPSKRAKGKKLCRQKVASRKNLQLKKTKSSSSCNSLQTGYGEAASSPIASSSKHNEWSAAASSSPVDSQLATEDICSKQRAATRSCETKGGLRNKSVSEKAGFRITWNPVINLRTREDLTATSRKRKKGRPSKNLQVFIDSREALDQEICDHDKSKCIDRSESEVSQPSSQNKITYKSKQVRVSNGQDAGTNTNLSKEKINISGNDNHSNLTSVNGVKHHGDSTLLTERVQELSKTKMRDETTCSHSELKAKQKSQSTYEVVMAPMIRGFKSNIFKNTKSSKALNLEPVITEGCNSSKPPLNSDIPQIIIYPKNKDISKTNKVTNPQYGETSKDLGKNERQQNAQTAKQLNNEKMDEAEVQSSYKIVFAPTASQSYADIGDNSSALALKLKFPNAQFSHSMQGKKIKCSNQQKPFPFHQNFSKDCSTSESAQSCHRDNDANTSKTSPNLIGGDKQSSTSQLNNIISNVQNECGFMIKPSNLTEKGRMNNAPKGQMSVRQADCVDLMPDTSCQGKIIQKPRKSRYYTVPSAFREKALQKSSDKLVIHRDNLTKVFNSMTESKKEKPVKPESAALKAMRLFRERLLGKSEEAADGAASDKAGAEYLVRQQKFFLTCRSSSTSTSHAVLLLCAMKEIQFSRNYCKVESKEMYFVI
ncbi:hypothetical protein RRG08_056804 [Elysia crispata]|uniref:snRNA-activating protein complex subunit 1 n=1 Tax=Elysia crispata TaxID=231223 RepID=A0AAE1DVR4_9GAST|nr:hypothetical protein RRG08_056804 [Elysia crispata]